MPAVARPLLSPLPVNTPIRLLLCGLLCVTAAAHAAEGEARTEAVRFEVVPGARLKGGAAPNPELVPFKAGQVTAAGTATQAAIAPASAGVGTSELLLALGGVLAFVALRHRP